MTIEPWDREVDAQLVDEANDRLQRLLALEHFQQEEILRCSDASQRQSYTPTEVAGRLCGQARKSASTG